MIEESDHYYRLTDTSHTSSFGNIIYYLTEDAARLDAYRTGLTEYVIDRIDIPSITCPNIRIIEC